MARPAQDAAWAAFECFLVEDVILTLGNLRGSLGWLGKDSATDRACVDRLDRQLGLLQDRARRIVRLLREESPAPEPDNIFAASATGTCSGGAATGNIHAARLCPIARQGKEAPSEVFRSRRG